MLSAKKQADSINERVNKYFIPNIKARYQINIVNDRFDKRYNFFFLKGKPDHFTRSLPLRTLQGQEYDIEYLEAIYRELKKQTNFTIKFICFNGQRWHSNDREIK
ncbi:MAG: hypothetical protein ABF991_00655 [Liquorilactobacillus hordei]|uniref:hypothetical protein n=1 Tax=Liquorilactobacillus hordei TaxID=468911 RepID=UPI0039E9BFF4